VCSTACVWGGRVVGFWTGHTHAHPLGTEDPTPSKISHRWIQIIRNATVQLTYVCNEHTFHIYARFSNKPHWKILNQKSGTKIGTPGILSTPQLNPSILLQQGNHPSAGTSVIILPCCNLYVESREWSTLHRCCHCIARASALHNLVDIETYEWNTLHSCQRVVCKGHIVAVIALQVAHIIVEASGQVRHSLWQRRHG
jgi:hypothetical protein